MRRVYVVTYDIADDKRLRRVFKIMKGYGDHLQFSVFRCELSDRDRFELIGDLEEVIHHNEDQVLLIPLGPAGGQYEQNIEALGKPYILPERHATVV